MSQSVEAVYEGGVLRPLAPLKGIREPARVTVTVDTPEPRASGLSECIGSLPDDDAGEMRRIIDEEFERIDLDEWR